MKASEQEIGVRFTKRELRSISKIIDYAGCTITKSSLSQSRYMNLAKKIDMAILFNATDAKEFVIKPI